MINFHQFWSVWVHFWEKRHYERYLAKYSDLYTLEGLIIFCPEIKRLNLERHFQYYPCILMNKNELNYCAQTCMSFANKKVKLMIKIFCCGLTRFNARRYLCSGGNSCFQTSSLIYLKNINHLYYCRKKVFWVYWYFFVLLIEYLNVCEN